MFDEFSDGYCPQCMLDNQRVDMVLNMSDFWECPKCRLQAHSASPMMFAILRERGTGKLRKEKATSQVSGCVLTKARVDAWYRADSSGFPDEEALRRFLREEVKETAG